MLVNNSYFMPQHPSQADFWGTEWLWLCPPCASLPPFPGVPAGIIPHPPALIFHLSQTPGSCWELPISIMMCLAIVAMCRIHFTLWEGQAHLPDWILFSVSSAEMVTSFSPLLSANFDFFSPLLDFF